MTKSKLFVKILTGLLLFAPLHSHAQNSVVIFEKNSNPLIYTQLIFLGGNLLEKHPGESYLLGILLKHSKLSAILERSGATLQVNPEYDYFSLAFEMLDEYQEDALVKVLDFLIHYQPTTEEFQLAKSQLDQELRVQQDDFYHVVRYAFYERLYGKHRYGQQITGTRESLEKIQLEDLTNLLKRMLVKERISLVLVGNVKKLEAQRYEKILALMPNSPEKSPSLQPGFLAPLSKDQLVRLKAASSQTFVRIGTLGVTRRNPAYLDYLLISDMVGGGFGSLVMKKLREEKGLTYTPVANFYSLRQEKGYFFVAYSTRSENLSKSLKLVQGIFKSLETTGINFHNFSLSCRYLYGILLNQQETNAGMASILAEAVVFGLPLDYWEKDRAKLKAMIMENERIAESLKKNPGQAMEIMETAENFQRVNVLVRDFFKQAKWLTVILQAQG